MRVLHSTRSNQFLVRSVIAIPIRPCCSPRSPRLSFGKPVASVPTLVNNFVAFLISHSTGPDHIPATIFPARFALHSHGFRRGIGNRPVPDRPNHTVEYTYTHFASRTSRTPQQGRGRFLFDAKIDQVSIGQHPDRHDQRGRADLDKELVSPTFFDARGFRPLPSSTTVTSTGTNKLAVAGDLTIHGVTKPVTLDVTVNKIGTHPMRSVAAAGFDATATIKRSDFGVALYVPNVATSDAAHHHGSIRAPKRK